MLRKIWQQLRLPQATLLEGVVTTQNKEGSTNTAPMGPLVDADFHWLLLRPFSSSTTYQNLARSRQGVLHVTDDVELIVRAAIGTLDPPPPLLPIDQFPCPRLADTCRWYAFRIEEIETPDDDQKPASMIAQVVDQGSVRDFFGFNRAKHAVLEGAILATRIDLLPADDFRAQFERLVEPVRKTAGEQELRAFAILEKFVKDRLGGLR